MRIVGQEPPMPPAPSNPPEQQPAQTDRPLQTNELQTSSLQAEPHLPPDSSVALSNLKRNVKIVACISFFSFVVLALTFTFLEAIFPVLLYSTATHLVFSPGETRFFTINKFFCSSLSIDTAGSSHLSASLKQNPS